MASYGGLASTGFTAAVFGYTFGGIELVIFAVALVVVGAALLRTAWRPGKAVNAR